MVVQSAAFAEESAEVQVLQASLTKTKDLTKRITASLGRLDASGRTVKDAIAPIYSNTQQLQITARNIDRVNEAIDKLRLPSASKEQEERIIRAGPRNASLQDYLGAMRRVDRNLNNLAASNMRINQQETSELHGLLTLAVNQLLELYGDDVREENSPIEPLHYITKALPFPTIPKDHAQHLGQLASAIVSASDRTEKLGQRDDDPGVRIYAEIRGDYLQNSLQNLAAASISTAKRGANDTSVYRPGTNAIGTYAQGLESMLLAEFENVKRIFPNDSVGRAFGATCSKALATFSKTLAELNAFIKSRIMTDCFLAYEIISLVTPLSYRLEKQTGQLRGPISDALRPVRDTSRSSLSEIISRTRSQADQVTTLPPDGNTIALVHETAARIRTLGQFDGPLLHLLTSIGDGGWRKDASNTGSGANGTPQSSQLNLTENGAENRHLLANYIADILDVLVTTLTTRSAQIHRAKPIQGIFLQNTLAVLLRALVTSPEIGPYLSAPGNSIASRLEEHKKPAISSYMTVWREPSNQLLDTISTSSSARPTSGSALDSQAIIKSLSGKDKDKIKEKFKAFTQLFDEQVARHKSLYMEREVSIQLQRAISQQIEPLYARFWDRYHELDKGKGKTVKYTKTELAQVLAGL